MSEYRPTQPPLRQRMDEAQRIVRERLTAALRPRRADRQFADRLRRRIREDEALLRRIEEGPTP